MVSVEIGVTHTSFNKSPRGRSAQWVVPALGLALLLQAHLAVPRLQDLLPPRLALEYLGHRDREAMGVAGGRPRLPAQGGQRAPITLLKAAPQSPAPG